MSQVALFPQDMPLLDSAHAELRALRDVLTASEEVLFTGRGYVIRGGFPAIRRWTIVVTNHRLLCIRAGGIGARTVIDIARDDVLDLRATRSLGGWQLVITGGFHLLRIQLPREQIAIVQRLLAPDGGGSAGHVRTPSRNGRSAAAGAAQQAGGVRTSYEEMLGASTVAHRAAGDSERIIALESTVERLETEVERLQQQVDFVEEMMRARAGE